MSDSPTSAPNRIINLDSEYKIKIEKGNEFNNSIFADVYRQARQNVADILSHSNDDNKHDSYNNIIAFTGERGKGKSSTMISFLESLVNKEDKENHKEFYTKEDESDIDFSKFNFLTIDVIDPSLFRREEQLFEIIIAKLFSQFRKEVEDKNGKHVNDEDRRELVKLFQQVFENLKYINNRADIYKQDALDALIKLSTSSNLKDNFDELIAKYLTVFGQGGVKNFLVIAIDDFDLKIDGVYEMIEDIRQYFITKNIIILMACKMEQLRESLIRGISKIKYAGIDSSLIEDSILLGEKEITTKLIEKIIPFTHQITIPSVSEIYANKQNIKEPQFLDTRITTLLRDNFNIWSSKHKYRHNVLYPTTLRNYISLQSVLNTRNTTIIENFVLTELKKLSTKLYDFYLTKNYIDRTSVLVHFISLFDLFTDELISENKYLSRGQKSLNINEIKRIISYEKIEFYTPSRLISIFERLEDIINLRKESEIKRLEILKILFQLDYNNTVYDKSDLFKKCYIIDPDLFATQDNIAKNISIANSRDKFRVNYKTDTDLSQKLKTYFSIKLGDSQLDSNNPIALVNNEDRNELLINKRIRGLSQNMIDQYKNSSYYVSNKFNTNDLQRESVKVVYKDDNTFKHIVFNEEFIWLLFLENFGYTDSLNESWTLNKFSLKYEYLQFNLFHPIHTLKYINEKGDFFGASFNLIIDFESDFLFYDLIDNPIFVQELYSEIVSSFENHYKAKPRPFINEEKIFEDYSVYIKDLYLEIIPSVVDKLRSKYTLLDLTYNASKSFFKELFETNYFEKFSTFLNQQFNVRNNYNQEDTKKDIKKDTKEITKEIVIKEFERYLYDLTNTNNITIAKLKNLTKKIHLYDHLALLPEGFRDAYDKKENIVDGLKMKNNERLPKESTDILMDVIKYALSKINNGQPT